MELRPGHLERGLNRLRREVVSPCEIRKSLKWSYRTETMDAVDREPAAVV